MNTPQLTIDTAVEYVSAGQPVAALQILESLESQRKPIEHLFLLKSTCYMSLGKYTDAKREIIREQLQYPSNIAARNLRGTIETLIKPDDEIPYRASRPLPSSTATESELFQDIYERLWQGETDVALNIVNRIENAFGLKEGLDLIRAKILYVDIRPDAAANALEREIINFPENQEATELLTTITEGPLEELIKVLDHAIDEVEVTEGYCTSELALLLNRIIDQRVHGNILIPPTTPIQVCESILRIIKRLSSEDRRVITSAHATQSALTLLDPSNLNFSIDAITSLCPGGIAFFPTASHTAITPLLQKYCQGWYTDSVGTVTFLLKP